MEATSPTSQPEKTSWLDRPLLSVITLNWESILFATILLLALFSHLYNLGVRVMSHDETSHVYFSWRLYTGMGYKHDPVTHGPLQFHLIALSYFLFGDNDFTARLPHALAGVAAIAFLMFNYRRYLGRAGTIVASILMLISPFMLYYGRYARNESLVTLFGVMTLWAILRYFETGTPRYLYWLSAATVLHFATKETAFIYTAQALVFVFFYFVLRVSSSPWPHPEYRNRFLIALILTVLLLVGAAGIFLLGGEAAPLNPAETAPPSIPGESITPALPTTSMPILLLGVVAFIALVAAFIFLLHGYSLSQLRTERSFDILILLGTLVLPMLSPFLVKFLGWNPTDYSSTGMLRTAIFLIPLALVALGIGLWWNRRLWLGNAALFYGIFTVFFTTIFTNGAGFFTGIVGSLGYWLEQQGVHRGQQPWYYYLFLQVPVYEYLPALGSLLALGLGIAGKLPGGQRSATSDQQTAVNSQPSAVNDQPPAINSQGLAVTLLGYWVVTSVIAYSYAGEKMPWLTVHITLPMILLSGWSFGYLIERFDWSVFRNWRGWIVLPLLFIFITSLAATLGSLLGTHPPFQGKELTQLQDTSTFLVSLATVIGSGWGLVYLLKPWQRVQALLLAALAFFGVLAVLTARTAITASFINYDFANEYLVYAHAGPGNKLVMNQIEEISQRLTDGQALVVAYDNETTYPFWWYLRDYPNQRYYATNPTRDLREVPIILVGNDNYSKLEPVVGQGYYQYDYNRMWWPNQDYYNMTWERIWSAIRDPKMRLALFQIWFNRDFTQYGALTNQDVSLPNWQPADDMRMYIRKDTAAKIWNFGVGPSEEEIVIDPYEGKEAKLTADQVIGGEGSTPGTFKRPRDLALAPDGSLYIADTDNHRIQHLDRSGKPLHAWGSFADIAKGEAPAGTFYEPWGIAVAPDGSVYVADTWNHRIQKFTSDGKFVTMWGYFGQAERPDAFWGPRDVLVDADGHVLVTDTGNKRVVIFDADGNYINQFGSEGFAPGEFNEPVGMALDSDGRLYVVDTWNQRIQVFESDGAGSYNPTNAWDVFGWNGQSLDNKPYLAVDEEGHVFAADPEGYRVLEFTNEGAIVRYWGDYSLGLDGFGLVGSVAADPSGGVWVSDAGNSRIMHFSLPKE